MHFIELLLLAIGLSMDAFAVAIIIGMTLAKADNKSAVIVGLYFGIFQGAMPFIGYTTASWFAVRIASYSHWVAFIFLAALGGKMIYSTVRDAKSEDDAPLDNVSKASLAPMAMLPLAFGTSVDALAAGVPLAFLYVDIVPAVLLIGVITFFLSAIGVRIGSAVGAKLQAKATLAGGIILILIGVWILLV